MSIGINWWESDPTLSSKALKIEEENRSFVNAWNAWSGWRPVLG